MAATAHKPIKETILYPKGTCSVEIKIDFRTGTFKLSKLKITETTNSEEIKEIYTAAGSYACQRLGQDK